MPPKKTNTRSYVHAFVLFPDNPEMLKIYEFLTGSRHADFQFMSIVHEPEAAEKKRHIHCMLCFENQRTSDGVRKSFGVSKTVWRLAGMYLKDSVTEKLKKIPKESTLVSDTGYYRDEIWHDSEGWILSDPDDPQSYIEREYKDGEKQCRDPCKIDQVWRLCPVWRVPHVEVVSDRCSYAMYMLHRDIQSTIDGVKHVYDFSDLVGDQDFIHSCFPVKKAQSKNTLAMDVINLSVGCNSLRQLLSNLVVLGRDDLIEFCMSHSYFVTQLISK